MTVEPAVPIEDDDRGPFGIVGDQGLLSVTDLLAHASTLIGAVPKASHNDAQGFYFRGISTILAHVQPVFGQLGIVVAPRVIERHVEVVEVGRDRKPWRLVTLLVRYRFHGPNGDFLDAVTVGEGLDPGDKAANKAMSASLKYALTQVLCLADTELDEADAQAAPDLSGQQVEPRRAAPSRPSQRRPQAPQPEALKLSPEDEERRAILLAKMNGIPDRDERARVKKAFLADFTLPAFNQLTAERITDAEAWLGLILEGLNPTVEHES